MSQQNSSGRRRSQHGSRSRSRDRIGPDTSTPVKSGEGKNISKEQYFDQDLSRRVRKRLEDEFPESEMSQASSVLGSARSSHSGGSNNSTDYNLNTKRSLGNEAPRESAVQDRSSSTFKRSFVSEYENGTIQAQREELQLLIQELKNRDQELNEMVKSHSEQIVAWEDDRKRRFILEEKCQHIEGELQRKNDQVKALVMRLKSTESNEKHVKTSLEESQDKLIKVSEQLNSAQRELIETQEKNKECGDMIKELSDALSKLESKKREMLEMFIQKDKDLAAATSKESSLQTDIEDLKSRLGKSEEKEKSTSDQLSVVKQHLQKCTSHLRRLKGDLDQRKKDGEKENAELEKARLDVDKLKKHIKTLNEKEKRQEDLIILQKNKQERTDAELQSLRQLYERQQKEISQLHEALERTRELLEQQRSGEKDPIDISLLLQSPVKQLPIQATVNAGLSKSQKTEAQEPSFSDQDEARLVENSSKENGETSKGNSHHEGYSVSDPGYVTQAAFEGNEKTLSELKSERKHENNDLYFRSGIPVRKQGSLYQKSERNIIKPVTDLNASIQDISEQSKKLAKIIEASRMKRAIDAAYPVNDQPEIPVQDSGTKKMTTNSSIEENSYSKDTLDNKSLVRREIIPSETMDKMTTTIRENMHLMTGEEPLIDRRNTAVANAEYVDVSDRDNMPSRNTDDNILINKDNAPLKTRHYTQPYSGYFENAHNIDFENLSQEFKPEYNLNKAMSQQDLSNQDVFGTPPRTSRKVSRQSASSNLSQNSNRSDKDNLDSSSERKGAKRQLKYLDTAEDLLNKISQDDAHSSMENTEYDKDVIENSFPKPPKSPDLSSIKNDSSNSQEKESPTSKMHRLLTESRQMVLSLERNAYPPFFQQERELSPIEDDPDLHDNLSAES